MALSSSSSMTSLFPIPVHVSSARIQHAFVNMNTDAMLTTRGVSAEVIQNHLSKRAPSSNVVDELWNDPSNADLVAQFLNNSFCITCAKSTDDDCLPLYQKYTVQDIFYLEDYVKYKSHRLITLPTGDFPTLQAEAASISSDAEFLVSFSKAYVTDLEGRATDLEEENRSIAELAYGKVMQSAADVQDWYNMHVISIPCIYGWNILAENLKNDPSTRKDTIFYRTWIEPNSDPSYASNLTAFLNANEAMWKDGFDTGANGKEGEWNRLFRTALKLEIALFATAFEK